MIKKTVIFAIVLLFAYAIMFSYKPIKISQDLLQGNIAIGQEYLFTDKTFDNVIVGSSLSGRVHVDSLTKTYSLALGGLSIFDGLTVLEQKKPLPRTVYVEMNVLEKNENSDFTDYFRSAIILKTKKAVPIFRADAKPIGYVIKVVNYPLNLLKRLRHNEGVKPQTTKSAIYNSGLFDRMLADQKKNYSNMADSSKIEQNMTNLKKHVLQLELQGSKVVFFEMPVDSSLRDLPRAKFIRNSFYRNFARKDFDYISIPRGSYFTEDGIHLTENSAYKYTRFLRSKMKK